MSGLGLLSPSRIRSSGQHHGSHSQAGFKRAMDLVREEFLQRLDFYQNSWLPARALVEEALAKRFQVWTWEEALWPWRVHAGRLLASWGSCSYPEPSEPAPLPLQVDPSGEIIELEKGGCPWKEHLYQLESGLSPAGTIAFVIYTDQAGQWRVQCVPKEPHSFQSR